LLSSFELASAGQTEIMLAKISDRSTIRLSKSACFGSSSNDSASTLSTLISSMMQQCDEVRRELYDVLTEAKGAVDDCPWY
jgi:hypothetical protein